MLRSAGVAGGGAWFSCRLMQIGADWCRLVQIGSRFREESWAGVGNCRRWMAAVEGVREEEGVYVPPWTRDIVTSPVNTGFFEGQPVTQPVTNPCQGRDKTNGVEERWKGIADGR